MLLTRSYKSSPMTWQLRPATKPYCGSVIPEKAVFMVVRIFPIVIFTVKTSVIDVVAVVHLPEIATIGGTLCL